MADTWSAEKRSAVMSLVKSHGNKSTELKLIKLFRAAGITGWRRKQDMLGKPDFVFRALHVAVFVDGCFWHGCPIHGRIPKSRLDFWMPKLAANKIRDYKVNRELRRKGWRVVRLWECDLTKIRSSRALCRIIRSLNKTKD